MPAPFTIVEFKIPNNGFKIVFFRREEYSGDNELLAATTPKKSTQKILDIIRNNSFVTITELVRQIGLSESGVKKQLRILLVFDIGVYIVYTYQQVQT